MSVGDSILFSMWLRDRWGNESRSHVVKGQMGVMSLMLLRDRWGYESCVVKG